MGLFGSSTAPPAPATPNDTIAPNRSQRAACWEGRDGFFKCLDRNGIIDAGKEKDKASAACKIEEAKFEKTCVASWVEYFKKRRVMEYNREKMLKGLQAEGARQVEMPTPISAAQVEKPQ